MNCRGTTELVVLTTGLDVAAHRRQRAPILQPEWRRAHGEALDQVGAWGDRER